MSLPSKCIANLSLTLPTLSSPSSTPIDARIDFAAPIEAWLPLTNSPVLVEAPSTKIHLPLLLSSGCRHRQLPASCELVRCCCFRSASLLTLAIASSSSPTTEHMPLETDSPTQSTPMDSDLVPFKVKTQLVSYSNPLFLSSNLACFHPISGSFSYRCRHHSAVVGPQSTVDLTC